MSDICTFFSGGPVLRSAELRAEPERIAEAWDRADTYFLPVWRDNVLVKGSKAAFLDRVTATRLGANRDSAIFLGALEGRFVFALNLHDVEPETGESGGKIAALRALMGTLDAQDAALLAYARSMANWHDRQRYCGVCGAATRVLDGGFVLACSENQCGHRSFPRLDPAVIVLVHRGPHCLLGRQISWPEGRFSTIAGFVEPGESLEDAVRREVLEETDVRVSRCDYMASQPWPFPAALMIGFHAEATSSEIHPNDGELAEARWLTRDELRAGSVVLPPPRSVAFSLIARWVDQDGGALLESLGRSGDFRSMKQ